MPIEPMIYTTSKIIAYDISLGKKTKTPHPLKYYIIYHIDKFNKKCIIKNLIKK